MRKKDIINIFSDKFGMTFSHSIRKNTEKSEYSVLVKCLSGCKDMFVESAFGQKIQWAGSDFKILLYLPICENWCLSAYYSPDNEMLFWYFDISRKNLIDEDGMLCMDDIFLDLVIQPDGQTITLDEDELHEALEKGEITKVDFDNAYIVHDQIKNSNWSNVDFLNEISSKLLLEHELGDIPNFENFAQIKPITKGWSEDKKYCITKTDGAKFLLRVTPISRYETRKSLFEMLKQVAALDIPMCVPLDFGTCIGGVYSMQSWIYGEDLETALPMLPETEQYVLGLKSGEILRKLHSIPAPKSQEQWEIRFNRKTDEKIKEYNECGLRFNGDEHIFKYIERNRYLLKNHPQCFQHGDYHVGNMMIENGDLKIIDFDRYDFGDPWEEFNRIVFSATTSPHFATGQLRGYFGGEPPIEFFKLLAYYLSVNTLASLPWALHFGQSDIDYMMKLSQDVLAWYDNMKKPMPTWYLKDFYVQWTDGVPYKLKEPFDFSFLSKYGKMFKVFDDQDSGNICFGMMDGKEKRFVKFAGAPTERGNVTPSEAIERMKSTIQIYKDLSHPILTNLLYADEIGGGIACVFEWLDAECMGRQYPQSREQFMQISPNAKLKIFDDILSFHAHVVKQGYAAIDFYDGCIMYDFNKGKTAICDIELYEKAPATNNMGRMYGSSCFMSPEEFQFGAIIDEITNVYTMGATAFELFGDNCDRSFEKWTMSKALYNVTKQAVSDERSHRQQSVEQFITEWRAAKGVAI